jgi:hypothetical protein
VCGISYFLAFPVIWQLLFVRTYLYNMGCQGEQSTERYEEALLCEVEAFCLASHFFWGLWSAVNAKSQIPFGYCVSTLFPESK